MAVKKCNKCGVTKQYSDFSRRGEFGLQPKCKSCNAVYRSENREAVSSVKRRWVERNPVRVREIKEKYWETHKPRILKRMAEWKRNKPESRAASNISRRIAHKNAFVSWAVRFFIDEAYHLSRIRSIATGIKWHVDHIVPIRSKIVSGLHVENNLQVIPASENYKKNNRTWPDMPDVDRQRVAPKTSWVSLAA